MVMIIKILFNKFYVDKIIMEPDRMILFLHNGYNDDGNEKQCQ
jgi:hypothetical protein